VNGLAAIRLTCAEAPVSNLNYDSDMYEWTSGKIKLTRETASSETPHAQLCALHELAHWQQHREKPWLMWLLWLKPVRWWLEMDAWQRATKMLKSLT